MEDFIETIPLKDDCEGEKILENYTKWKINLEGKDSKTLNPHERLSLDKLKLPIKATLEWREEYNTEIFLNEQGDLLYKDERPWYGSYGLYNHYYIETKDEGQTLRFMPTFMFGAKKEVIDKLYDGPDAAPMIGIVSSTPGMDRIIFQSFMNLVILTVIFLLWSNNPKKKVEKED